MIETPETILMLTAWHSSAPGRRWLIVNLYWECAEVLELSAPDGDREKVVTRRLAKREWVDAEDSGMVSAAFVRRAIGELP